MEELFSGSGNGGGGGGGGAAEEAPEPVKEKEAFDLKLTEVPAASKIKAIKEVRAITGLGLKEVSNNTFNKFLQLFIFTIFIII